MRKGMIFVAFVLIGILHVTPLMPHLWQVVMTGCVAIVAMVCFWVSILDVSEQDN